MLQPIHLFSGSFPEARKRFLAACEVVAGDVRVYDHPLAGPDGGAVATDCCWFGPRDAERVLVLLSGTHGVEGFAGAGPQLDWLLHESARLPHGMAALVIHGINSWGYAWLRRTTEEGVDLNRNFVDYALPLPVNPGYDAIASALVPDSVDEEGLRKAEEFLDSYRLQHGDAAYLTARGSGQYNHPGGLFYGGVAPTYSRLLTERIAADYALAGRKVAVIDYHTGLGPHGHGELIAGHDPDSDAAQRSRDWYGSSLTEPLKGTSITVPLLGMSQYGWSRLVGDGLTFVSLEFGTLPPRGMQRALAQDHWLHNNGHCDWPSEQTRRIKKVMYDAYCPPEEAWREMVLFRCRQVARQATTGLQAQRG
jgi:hypothetical protein